MTDMADRNPTRPVRIGSVMIGGSYPIAVQSMTATRTRDINATVEQINQLQAAGADVVRIAVDSTKDVEALISIRKATTATLSVDLQENYRLAEHVAPHVDKVRYNPGHLYHHEPDRAWEDKVRYLAETAARFDCALRVGVNCGSLDPQVQQQHGADDALETMLQSALEHCNLLDRIPFTRYCVSLKDSDPRTVLEANRRFAAERPDVPLHLGVTEAGMPPEGIVKTRLAIQPLLLAGIGDTLRVSLTVANDQKWQEIQAAREILRDASVGRGLPADPPNLAPLNIVSCPSCSRVENGEFVALAQRVRQMTQYARDFPITIAVMGCRVNGPGETDDADLGLWCGPKFVNLKRGAETLGSYPYDTVLDRLKQELDTLIAERFDP